MNKKTVVLIVVLLLAVGTVVFVIKKQTNNSGLPMDTDVVHRTVPPVASIEETPEMSESPVTTPIPSTPKPQTQIKPPIETKKPPAPPPVPKNETKPEPPPVMPVVQPPPVEIHKELIPKDIEIVRIYYAADFSAPGAVTEFDINGTGFTEEFERMISVDAGHKSVVVNNFKLMTPNQIKGEFHIGKDVPTSAIFPSVLIQDKVVFRADRPYAVIRPGEVLNLVFTQMGESGRSGRFRVFTNLTEKMHADFRILASTPGIQITNLTPTLPFLVDADIVIGPVPTGTYGLKIQLGKKSIWEREGLINVVQPNVGDAGLVQRIRAVDGFHRPGDIASFILQGSGFQAQDKDLLSASIPGWAQVEGAFMYIAPGRMDYVLTVSSQASIGAYNLIISQGDNKIMEATNAFMVVPPNWGRGLRLDPPLKPGTESTLILEGRDFSQEFIDSLEIETDEPALHIGKFTRETPNKATTSIRAESSVAPGDYWLRMTSKNGEFVPQFGSIIRVQN